MVIWGGWNGGSYFNSGGRYNPAGDSWTTLSAIGAPVARNNHTAVWTGSEMIVWGGWNGVSYYNSGGRYNPVGNSWTAVATAGAPVERYLHTATWAGTEMIVWGGYGRITNEFGSVFLDFKRWRTLPAGGQHLDDVNHQRPACAAFQPYGCVDGDRDDCLGRNQWTPQLSFERWRQLQSGGNS
jgi:hypothetical protein